MTGRRLTAPAGAPSVDELAGLIDQALELLSAYDTDEASLSEAEPLPSLLAQCQMLVDRPDSEPPILRAVVSFGPLDTAAERLLLAQANLELLRGPGTPGSGARETRDAALPPAIRRADLLRAQQTALHGLARDLNASGRRLVVVLDALAGEADLLESGPGDGHDPEEHAQDQAVPRLILSCHPLRSYLLARQRGLLPLGMATLEDYAAACLQILERLPTLPHLQLETLSTDVENEAVEAALAELCTALRLPPALDTLALDLPALDPVPPGALLYADGSPATGERLDSPAYQDLCRRLGYAPEQMPAGATTEQARGATAPLPALPVRRTDRGPSRLSAMLPRLAAVLEGDAALTPFRLDLHALVARVEDCLGHPDGTLEAIDTCVKALPPRDAALVLITCAAHFEAVGEVLQAQSLLADADPLIPLGDRPLRLLSAELLLRLGGGKLALETLLADAFDGQDVLSSRSGDALRRIGRLKIGKRRAAATSRADSALKAADHRPPVIVIAGMRHSGSTALFNLVRLGFIAMGAEPLASYSEIGDFVKNAPHASQPAIIKTHEMRDDVCESASIILTTKRDLRDTVASGVRRDFYLVKRLNSPVEYAKYNRMLHEIWAPLSDYQFNYERYMSNPLDVTSEVFRQLGIDPGLAAQIVRQVRTLPVDQYETTLLSPTHVTDPERKLTYADTLDPDAVQDIERNHKAWLIANGYPVSPRSDQWTQAVS